MAAHPTELGLVCAGTVLFVTGFLPREASWTCALLAIIVLGIPHGALDVEIARTMLRSRLGNSWFGFFALPYLLLFALVIIAWKQLPLCTLAVFLAASVWHFGCEGGIKPSILKILVWGGLPIAAPLLIHPVATTFVLWTIASMPPVAAPSFLWDVSLCWALLALVWLTRMALLRRWGEVVTTIIMLTIIVVTPPLTAFAIYFVCIHAPTHVRHLMAHPVRAPRVTDAWSAARLALPVTALSLLIGAALWPVYQGSVPVRLLSLTIQGLAALTLPHMLFDLWIGQREKIFN